jgi:hypothetical protein
MSDTTNCPLRLPQSRSLQTAALATLLPLMCGCASSSGDVGVRVGDATLSQFEAGVTTESWLVAVLGEPSSSSVVEGVENTRVLRYATSEHQSGLVSVLTGRGDRNTAVTYFIVSDGVVTRFWADRSHERTLLGERVESETGSKQPE